jgi:hypothetical protein
MSKKTVKISEATLADLAEFGTNVCGLDVKPKTPIHILRAKVQTAWGKDEFEVDVADEAGPLAIAETVAEANGPAAAAPHEETADERQKRREAEDQQYVTVLIAANESPGGNDPVWLSVNGRGQWVERGKEQKIRMPYLRVLESSVQYLYEQLPDGGIGEARKVPLYPFSRIA